MRESESTSHDGRLNVHELPPVVDVQTHLYPQAYLDALAVVARGSGRAAEIARETLADPLIDSDPLFTGDLRRRLELMDAAGVDTHVLSFPAPFVWSDDAEQCRVLTTAFNDGCAEVVRDHPGRFALVATLPLPHVDESISEAERALDELEAVGVSLCTHCDGMPIEDVRFDPLYAFLSEREVPVLLHPDGFSAAGALADYGMEWAIGAPFDDTIVALRVVYSGLLDRHPGIEWIVPHLGGTLPFLLKRVDRVWQRDAEVQELLDDPPSTHLRRLWFDTVNPDDRCLQLSAAVLGADRLMYASDFPFASRQDLGFSLALLDQAGLAGDERAGVAGGTAAEVLGLR
jgi:aminocarboxymuconate-semialdehyde decarboxylase